MPDPYKLLKLPYDVDELTARKRYRALAKDHHPNAGGDGEDFRVLKEAFDTIISNIRNENPVGRRVQGHYRAEKPRAEAPKQPSTATGTR